MNETLLIIDDEPEVRDAIRDVFASRFQIVTAEDGESGLRRIRDSAPDLILLDLLMPGMSGIDVCKKIRSTEEMAETPVIMMTATNDDDLRTSALLAGANDLVSKPFRPKEFLVRIQAELRNHRQPNYMLPKKAPLVCGNLTLDPSALEVAIDGKSVKLTVVEIRLLQALIQNRELILDRQKILDLVWQEKDVSDRVVDNHILSLRKKLADFDHEISSVYGAGYGIRRRAR